MLTIAKVIIVLLLIWIIYNLVKSYLYIKDMNTISTICLKYIKKVKCSNTEICKNELLKLSKSININDPYIEHTRKELIKKINNL